MTNDYETVSLTGESYESGSERTRHQSHTETLGCAVISVEAYRLPPGGEVTLPAPPEQACVPIDTDARVGFAGTRIPTPGIGFVPAGIEGTVRCSTATQLLVVGASAEPAGGQPRTVALEECEFPSPPTSSIGTARLTDRLGCAGMKVNARVLSPGERVPYHTEGSQEELFVPVRGPAAMRIDDETGETPVGTVTRVAPPVPRSALNDGDAESLWIMIGAPPTGGPTEWDPGAEILE
ncbi:MAG: hypothetical protein ABEH56_06290 [Salinirussus sp.]